jgi:hypothetical protein
MRFLYCRSAIPLDDLCGNAHLRAAARVPELDLVPCIGVQADACRDAAPRAPGRSPEMLDVVMLAVGLGFFALSVGYAMACDRL